MLHPINLFVLIFKALQCSSSLPSIALVCYHISSSIADSKLFPFIKLHNKILSFQSLAHFDRICHTTRLSLSNSET